MANSWRCVCEWIKNEPGALSYLPGKGNWSGDCNYVEDDNHNFGQQWAVSMHGKFRAVGANPIKDFTY